MSLARAFVLQPEMLLLDEPFTSLDSPTRIRLLDDLKSVLDETRTTSIFITHDLDATWAVNVLYHFQVQDGSIPYMFITPEQEFYFQPNNAVRERVRNVVFNGNTSDAVAVLHQTGDSCLRVLDAVYMYDPLLNEAHEKLIPLSDLSRIIPDAVPVPPDTDVFGPEPTHTWCYFFEKADLARQSGNWNGDVLKKIVAKPVLGYS